MLPIPQDEAASRTIDQITFGKSAPLNLARLAYGAKETSTLEFRSVRPCVDGKLDPARHGDRPHMASFANKVCKNPMFLSKLKVLDSDGHEFRSA